MWPVLIGNLASVALVLAVWLHLRYRLYRLSKNQISLGFGACVSVAIIVSMLMSVELVDGIYFDLRTSLLVISGAFGGPLSMIVTTPVALAFRAFKGGAGMEVGMIGIMIASAVGLAGHIAFKQRIVTIKAILILALAAALSSLATMSLLPASIFHRALETMGLPIGSLNFVATALAGLLIKYFHHFTLERDILRAALTQAPDFHYVKNLSSEFVVTNLNVAQHNGRRKSSEMIGLTDFDIASPERAAVLFEAEQRIIKTGEAVIEMEELLSDDGGERWFTTSKVVLKNRHGETVGIAGVTREITAQKKLQAEVLESQNLLSQAMAEMSDGLAMFNQAGYLVFCNDQYRASFPRSSYARKPGAHITDIIRAVVRNGERADVNIDASEEWIQAAADGLHRDKDEDVPLWNGHWLTIRTRQAQDGSALVVVSDSTEMKRSEQSLRSLAERMKGLAETDGLTGIANRRTFDERLAQASIASSESGLPVCLLLIDVDHFKAYNDTYGHPAGDRCLIAVGECLQTIARRNTDVVARYGGEEFAVLLPDTQIEEANVLAEQFRSALQALSIEHSASDFGVLTASIGVAASVGGSSSCGPLELISRSDAALYDAKRTGRNKAVIAHPAVSEKSKVSVG